MSLQATLDLCINASPRSLCIFDARLADDHKINSNNPFDGSSNSTENALAVVSGTERGSLHFRTYHTPRHNSNKNSLSAASMMAAATTQSSNSSMSSSAKKPQTPLGLSSSGRASSALPRTYFPVDLTSLPGAVVDCIPLISKSKSWSSTTAPHFLLLLDDNRGSSSTSPGQYAALVVTLTNGTFHVVQSSPKQLLPKRISCAVYHHVTGLVYGYGRHLVCAGPEAWQDDSVVVKKRQQRRWKPTVFANVPAPGMRGGQDAMTLTAQGRVAVLAVGNAFYAVAGQEVDERQPQQQQHASDSVIKMLTFSQSSQVHPVVILDLHDESLDADWSSLFLANGRECAVVDLYYGPPTAPAVSCSKPRHGTTVSLPSPVLGAASSSSSWLVVLTSDGMLSVRSPSCLAVALRTIEVGQRPNDFFVLRTHQEESQSFPWLTALAYSGECKVLQCQPDTAQDLADRLMRLAIDAFGANGFPRSELAEAVSASFTATSYVGPEPTSPARNLLSQYLSAILELSDFESGGKTGWPTDMAPGDSHHGSFSDSVRKDSFSGRGLAPTMLSSASPAHLMAGSALLCLTCSQLSSPTSGLACRAAKSCAIKLGVVFEKDVPAPAAQVCELVAEKLLREVSEKFSLTSGSSSTPISHMQQRSSNSTTTEFVEASVWLLRSAGKHERAIEVAHERLLQRGQEASNANNRALWSRIKFDSYTATHLSDIWSSGKEEGFSVVLRSPATFRLLENNPRMGLSIFTAGHPQSRDQWETVVSRNDPLSRSKFVYEVVKLLKTINPVLLQDSDQRTVPSTNPSDTLPLESGRALAVAFLESAIGISTDRSTSNHYEPENPAEEDMTEHVANFHDELAFMLLEGVIAERSDESIDEADTDLGKAYRSKLQRLLKWPLAKLRPGRFMETLPSTFLQEKALLLGRIGQHEEALRILYRDLSSLDLALEYCDDRYERQTAQRERNLAQKQWGMRKESFDDSMSKEDNAYLPLVRVALDSDDTERGVTAAIQVLALRRGAIDRAAALRLLPSGVPVSAVARPFLIPALVDSESQVRRMTLVSSLLRARYLRLQDELTVAQLKAQSNLYVVPQLRRVDLGDLLHSSNAFRVRTSTPASSTMPELMVVKHFFPRHLVIQVKVTNTTGSSSDLNKVGRILTDITFVVAESSEDAIQPQLQVPIQTLPPKLTGCAWCVLDANPSHMDGATAQLTCELRYTVQPVDAASRSNAGIASSSSMGRTFVEELQDLEVHASHFS